MTRIYTECNGGVLELHFESAQNVTEINGPRAFTKAFLLDEAFEVIQDEVPVTVVENHQAAGQATVPVVPLLVVEQLVHFSIILKYCFTSQYGQYIISLTFWVFSIIGFSSGLDLLDSLPPDIVKYYFI